ncbi:MAG: hypothetical protein ACRC1R_00010 [Cetobacterium sp.]|uniref:hypothetical protein n=1 Tax=Cetobacterium sp. TaxID=2071632 RepID=UPI003F4139B0
MGFFELFSMLVGITLIILFWNGSNYKETIYRIRNEVETKLRDISSSQQFFSVPARNCNITFYKDYFRVDSKILKLNNGNISYSDISFIECSHESYKLKIKINLISNSNETLKFYTHSEHGPSFETFLENYFLVKLFLQKYKKIKVKKGE